MRRNASAVLFTAGQWAAWMTGGCIGAGPKIHDALDAYGKLARAIGAAEAHESLCSCKGAAGHDDAEALAAIIRELEGA